MYAYIEPYVNVFGRLFNRGKKIINLFPFEYSSSCIVFRWNGTGGYNVCINYERNRNKK